jgi:hypothetical protein
MTRSLLIFLLAVSPAAAQFNAAIQGTVTDSTSSSVPNAKVTLTNRETNIQQSTQTSGTGFYRFSGLAPGRYALSIEASGFKKESRENISVSAEQLQGVNVTLTPGALTESITVRADAGPGLHTEDASIGRTITTAEIQRLPQFNRDPYELLRFTPGVFGNGARDSSGNAVALPNTTGPGGSNASIFQTENQVAISANGQRLSDNNFMVDGVTVNSLNWGGAAVLTPNQESIKEITVQSESYSAEYGRNSGAQVQVVSRNGTDQFHGSGFFKYNDPGLNAFNRYGGPLNAPAVRVENKFRQYGASLGGPIVRNHLFFFASYEGLRNRADKPYTAWVETSQYRQAVIAARPGSVNAKILQDPGVNPRVIAVLNSPCPKGFAAGTCQVVNGGLDIGSLSGAANQYVDIGKNPTGAGLDGVPDVQFAQLAAPSSSRGNQYNARVDYTRGNDSFAFSTYLTPFSGSQADTGAASRGMADLANKPFNSAYTLTYNRILSPTLFNEARVNLTRFTSNQLSASSNVNFGIPRIEVQDLPFDRIRFGAPQSDATPAIFAQNTIEVSDTLSKVLGRHAFKAGIIIRKEQNNDNLAGGSRPLYTFQGLWNLANSTPIFEQINANPNNGAPADAQRYLRSGDYSGFLQDDFKLLPNLTINLGLRYEYYAPLTDTRHALSNLFFGPNNDFQDSYIRLVDQLYKRDENNFAPRLGFAWNPTHLNNLVVRGGYGWFYNRIPGVVFENSAGNPPNFARFTLCCGNTGSPFDNNQIIYSLGADRTIYGYPTNPALAIGIDPVTGAPRGPSNPTAPQVGIYMAQRDTPNPYVQIYSFDLQYQLPHQVIATVGYSGSAGRKQIRLVNQNFLYPVNSATFPFSTVYNPQPDVNTNFNALLVTVSRAYSNGFQFQTNYRFSKSMDTLSYEGPGFVTNQTYPQNQATERGPSDFDTTHYFTTTALYDLPFYRNNQQGWAGRVFGGFTLSGALTAHSGFPWTPVTGQSVQTPGGPSLSPTRPIAYFGNAGHDTSNDSFINGTNFPLGGSKYFDITKGGFPGIGRNSWRGPHFFSVDMAVAKQVQIRETLRLDLRANLYNIFNKLNLVPIAFGSNQAHIEDPTFGLSPAGGAGRVVELQARFTF